MKEHDYAAAQTEFERIISVYLRETGESPLHEREAIKTIRHALRFAEKMCQEPSEGMIDAVDDTADIEVEWLGDRGAMKRLSNPEDIFKSMIDQALKELGE